LHDFGELTGFLCGFVEVGEGEDAETGVSDLEVSFEMKASWGGRGV
jgi:hypothetical protein